MYVSIRMRKLIPCYLKGGIETSSEELKDVRKKSSVVFFYKLRIKKTRYFNLRRRTRLRLVHLLEIKISRFLNRFEIAKHSFKHSKQN